MGLKQSLIEKIKPIGISALIGLSTPFISSESAGGDYLETQNIETNIPFIGTAQPLYKVFAKDSKVIFRQVGYKSTSIPSFMAPILVGDFNGELTRIIQPAPVRGIGLIGIPKDSIYFSIYEKRFEDLLKEYKSYN